MSLSPSEELSDSSVTSEEVDSGQYFRQGRAWSRLMFELPVAERSYALLALIITCMALIVTVMALSSIMPFSRPIRMLFENPNSGLESPRLIPLSADRVALPVALSRYVVGRYVVAREAYEYNRDTLDRNYRMVYNYSSPEQFTDYRKVLDPNNAQSPLNTLERSATRRVEDLNVVVSLGSADHGVQSGTAEVSYMEVVQRTSGAQYKRRNLHIAFTMNEITVSKAEKRVYQYDAAQQKMVPLTGAVLLRVSQYQPADAKS